MDVNTVIDLDWLKSATYADMKTVLNASSRYPEKVAQLNALFATPEGMAIANDMINDPHYVPVSKRPVDPAEAEQLAADLRLAEEQAAAEEIRLAEEARLIAETPPVVEVPVVAPIEEKKKIVVDYQATTEDGTPIGRPTHIEGWSHEEVIEKMKQAHVNAVRYAERVKRNKVQSIEQTAQQVQTEQQVNQAQKDATVAVELATKEKDPEKLQDAIRKTAKADRDAEIAKQTAFRQGQLIAAAWIKDHKEDFQECDANSKIMGDWMVANGLILTYENLELAYAANETKLAKPEYRRPVEEPVVVPSNAAPAAPVAPATPAPVIPAPVAVAPAPVSATPPVSQPVVNAPAPTPAVAANPAPAARRPGVNGSLPPGTLTAARPVGQQVPETTNIETFRKEVDKMSGKEFRQKVTTSKQFRDQLRAAGIPVLGEEQYKTSR